MNSMRMNVVTALALAGALLGDLSLAADETQNSVPPPAVAKRLEQWRAARFGMFVHWGPVSLKGTEIGWSRGAQIPIEEYDNLYRQFNPTNFNAREWAKLAKDAGMKYVVFTTKHHDGFCMWDTKQTDFNIMRSPFGRDVVKELAAACRQQGTDFGTYHSVCDWHHPDFPRTSPGGKVIRPVSNLDRYEQYLRAQVGELIQNYGPLLVMWFDVPQEFDQKRGLGLEQFTRSLQPNIIINNRSGTRGDYDTPEQRIGKFQIDRPWETCMTICQQWAWKPDDDMKSLQQCLQNLVLCAGGDGNLLFNVGPMPDGRIEPRQAERLREMGAWLKKYGETIYGTRGGPFKPTKTIASTRKDKTIFIHVLRWEGDTLSLPNIPAKIRRSSLLTGGKVKVKQSSDGISLKVSPKYQREIDTIVRIELDRPALDVAPVSAGPPSKAMASNVFQRMEDFAAESAFDNDPQTRWATDGGTKQAWVANDFGKPVTFDRVAIREAAPFDGRVQKFEFQIRDGAEWKTVFTGTTLGPTFTRKFPPVTSREIRLNILDATEGPTISEIQVSEHD
jgi:alpha-L-fucosidase